MRKRKLTEGSCENNLDLLVFKIPNSPCAPEVVTSLLTLSCTFYRETEIYDADRRLKSLNNYMKNVHGPLSNFTFCQGRNGKNREKKSPLPLILFQQF